MATEYYVDLHIAEKAKDQEDHVRVGLVDSIPELADAYVQGCRILLERGLAIAGDRVTWYAMAKEEGEGQRDLTPDEVSALIAAFEQKFPDVVVQPPQPPAYPPGD